MFGSEVFAASSEQVVACCRNSVRIFDLASKVRVEDVATVKHVVPTVDDLEPCCTFGKIETIRNKGCDLACALVQIFDGRIQS